MDFNKIVHLGKLLSSFQKVSEKSSSLTVRLQLAAQDVPRIQALQTVPFLYLLRLESFPRSRST